MTLYPKLILDALSKVRYPGQARILFLPVWLMTIFVLKE